MTDEQDICGEPCGDGSPCQREPGWGTDRETGACRDHVTDRPVLRQFTTEKRERIIGAAESGAFKTHIAQLAEISFNTLESWLEMGETDAENGLETDLAEFYCNWQRARGAGALETLQECSPEFLAERAYGYTKTERHELDHSGELDVTSDVVTITEDDLE